MPVGSYVNLGRSCLHELLIYSVQLGTTKYGQKQQEN